MGVCRNVVVASSAFSVVSGDYGKVPAPDSSLTVVSVDAQVKAEYESIFVLSKSCKDSPCLHGGICRDVMPTGFVCECPVHLRGPLCQDTTRSFLGGLGESYIWLSTLSVYERSTVGLEFSTKTADGLLLFQGPLDEGLLFVSLEGEGRGSFDTYIKPSNFHFPSNVRGHDHSQCCLAPTENQDSMPQLCLSPQLGFISIASDAPVQPDRRPLDLFAQEMQRLQQQGIF